MRTVDKLSREELGFIEFEHRVFGYGGAPHVLRALKSFCAVAPLHRLYDCEIVEHALTAPVAWLLINSLSHAGIIERGTSMRSIRFTDRGVFLAEFVRARSVENLVELIDESAKRDAESMQERIADLSTQLAAHSAAAEETMESGISDGLASSPK